MRVLILIIIGVFGVCAVAFAQKQKKDKPETTIFYVASISCMNCVKAIEGNIGFEKGVTKIASDLETKTVAVTYRPDRTSKEKLIAAFKKIKREAVVYEDVKPENP
jgi:Copper chaperone